MSDWDADDSWETADLPATAPTAATKAPAPVADDGDFFGGGDDWDATPAAAADWDDWDSEKPAAKTEEKSTASKKNVKQMLKEKEAAEKAAAAKAKKDQDAERLRMQSDPEYRAQKKEAEKAAIERSELEMISDLFGPGTGSSREEFRQEANPERARQLAAMTGLGDGADGPSENTGRNDWDVAALANQKTDKKAAPNPLDAIEFKTDADLVAFAKVLARKLKDVGVKGTTNNYNTMSRTLLVELIRETGPEMKGQDMDEVLRVGTVVKNEISKKTQNVKKNKGKKSIKLHDDGRDYSDEEFM